MLKRMFTGKTINDAKNKGLTELGVREEDVIITVLEQPSKGLLGLFGAREAKIEITVPDHPKSELQADPESTAPTAAVEASDPVQRARVFLTNILNDMGVEAEIEVTADDDRTVLQLSGNNIGMVIGRRGQTLDAIQTLMNAHLNRNAKDYTFILLDAERFRERRKKTLQDLSMRLANQVARTGRDVVLEPMTPSERRIIHYQLQNHPKVKTFSKGTEPNRRVVITLKS